MFDDTFDVSTPQGNLESPRLGDDRIRELKRAIRERLDVEHIFELDDDDKVDGENTGKHRSGSARIKSGTDTSKPSSPELDQLYYATDTKKLYHCKEAGTWTDITAEIAGFVRTTGDQTIAGVKTFSSSPVVPDPSNDTDADNKGSRDTAIETKFDVDEGHDHDGTNSKKVTKQLGSWASKSENQSYQAESDGFFIGIISWVSGGDTSGVIYGYSDSNNPPTTLRGQAHGLNYYNKTGNSFMIPVRKGDYYKATFDYSGSGSYSRTYYWIPFGS